jgi:membrane protease YdiL (CAAX protease family)
MTESENITGSRDSKQLSWMERNGFPTWLVVFGWIIIAFILFQVVGSVISLVLIYYKTGHILDLAQSSNLKKYLGFIFIGNTTGQIVFLGLGTLLVTRLAAPKGKVFSFLGFRYNDDIGRLIVLTVLLILAIQPVIWLLSWINMQIPFPESYLHFEDMQDKILQDFLSGNKQVYWTLFNVALVPAFCEEVLYRGFVLNTLKRKWGVTAAVLISGIVFGLYHVRFTQLIPLAFLGILLAILAWKSGSILPAMVAHFVNNATSVLIAYKFPDYAFSNTNADSLPPVIYIVLGFLVSGFLFYLFIKESNKSIEGDQYV